MSGANKNAAKKLPAKTLALLYRAVDNNDAVALKEWIAAHGTASIDQCPDHYSRTALLEACADRKKPEIVRALLTAGADPDHAGSNGLTPLTAAAIGDCHEIAEALIEAGADREKCFGSMTPLQYAVAYGNEAVTQALLKHGADVTLSTAKGETVQDLIFNDTTGKIGEMVKGEIGRIFCEKTAKDCTEGTAAPVQTLKPIKFIRRQ